MHPGFDRSADRLDLWQRPSDALPQDHSTGALSNNAVPSPTRFIAPSLSLVLDFLIF